MKKVFFITMMLVIGVINLADAEEPSCRDKLLKICATNEAGNPICQILKQDATETPESIVAFFEMIRPLEQERQELMICARFVGRKRLKLGIVDEKLKLYIDRSKDFLPWDGNTYIHYIFAHHTDDFYTGHLIFDFSHSNSIVDQWFILRRMNPFENDLNIVLTVDIDTASAKWSSGGSLGASVQIQKVISVDSESSRKIQQRMTRALKVGLE